MKLAFEYDLDDRLDLQIDVTDACRFLGEAAVMTSTKGQGDRYNDTAIHFDLDQLPRLLLSHLKPGPLALADLGCGDGPNFKALERGGFIGPAKPVHAVDLEEARLARVAARFFYITTHTAPADSAPAISEGDERRLWPAG